MASAGVGLMDRLEIMNFIKESQVGVLTLVDEGKPYGVPLEHHFDGKALRFIISPRKGRKISCIEKNPNACYVIYESRRAKPQEVSRCRSVVIEGQVTVDGSKLTLNINQIGNWKCPPAMLATCDVR
jgi:nitroimidazol reductase NimA-like FMN-containing flavoprotein (pyridoxamine 5'-phosphate oxidase superfamily)